MIEFLDKKHIKMIKIYKTKIDSDTDANTKYDLVFVKWNNEDIPRDIICSCKGYQYREKCKHIYRHNPETTDTWTTAKQM